MMNILEKYADLLVNYCVSLEPGQKLYINSSTLAEPLVREVYRAALKAGGIALVSLDFRDQGLITLEEGSDAHLQFVDPYYAIAMQDFDAYIHIRAPFYSISPKSAPGDRQQLYTKARAPYSKLYSERTGKFELKRNLCEYPTIAHAQNAGMTLEEFSDFIFNACCLYEENPAEEWRKVSRSQQKIVDVLNTKDKIRYKGENIDISFRVKDRTWINSDGKTNMPSGEVYTAPIEDTVNGTIHFAYPSMYQGQEVEGITLWVKDGQVEKWEAKKGKALLDKIFAIEGARYFGEVAIGTNTRIQRPVKNILYDEKIGGTVHMAVGQTYYQCGGKNQSSIHWDMIADMKNGGEIWADDDKIYDSGKFLFL
jgi:aminopeptidase